MAATAALSLLTAACGGSDDDADDEPADDGVESTDDGDADDGDADDAPDDSADDEDAGDDAAEPAAEPAGEPAEEADGDRVQVRWFVGLGTGSQDEQIDGQNAVVDEFNASQDGIQLVVEYVDNQTASDVLATQIAGGDAPDLIGPVGLAGSNAFAGQYLDLDPLVAASGYDIDQFGDAKDVYRTDDGLLGIPFAVFPSAIFYNRDLFDEAGLPYPPAEYGDGGISTYGAGTEFEGEWNFDKVTELAQILTVDANGADATSADFDASATEQWGYVNQWTEDPAAQGSFFGAGSVVADDGTAQVPETWIAEWKWYQQMVHELGVVPDSDEAGSDALAGNSFNSGRVAMANTHLWYTCCLADEDGAARTNWDLAAVPNYEGAVVSKLHGDSFRIHKDTEHPEETFAVLQYLLEDAALDLLTIYGAAPARDDIREDYFAALDEKFTQGVNWDVIMAGLAYPDVPNHEANMPNFAESDARIKELSTPLMSDPSFDIDAAVAELEADLNTIWSS
ncbi:MAG: extracellular solute-binding protein [Actinomycetota bacterium]